MAQTKRQKRLKALKYWEDRVLKTHSSRGFDRDYIKSQISILYTKLAQEDIAVRRICATCSNSFFVTEDFQYQCSYCRQNDVNSHLISVFTNIGLAASAAAQNMSNYLQEYINKGESNAGQIK